MNNGIDNTKTYYKGKLGVLDTKDAKVVTRKVPLATFDNKSHKMVFSNPDILKGNEADELRLYLRRIIREDCEVTRSDIVEIFKRLFPTDVFEELLPSIKEGDKEIIFTASKDNNETLYGLEYHSRIHFPILSLNNVETTYHLLTTYSEDSEKVYYEAVAESRLNIAMMTTFDTVIASFTKASANEVLTYASLFSGFRGSKRQTVFLQEMSSLAKGNRPEYGIHYLELPSFDDEKETEKNDAKTV